MSMHIEWVRATNRPVLVDESGAADFHDGHGSHLDPGNVGLFVASGEDGALIEGTRDEIAAYLHAALALVERPSVPDYIPSGTCGYPPGCDAPAMPGFRACQPHYILVGALLGNPDGPAPSDEAIAWANRVTHTTTV